MEKILEKAYDDNDTKTIEACLKLMILSGDRLALFKLAHLYSYNNNNENAITYYLEYLKYENSKEAMYELAFTYDIIENKRKAIKYYKMAYNLNCCRSAFALGLTCYGYPTSKDGKIDQSYFDVHEATEYFKNACNLSYIDKTQNDKTTSEIYFTSMILLGEIMQKHYTDYKLALECYEVASRYEDFDLKNDASKMMFNKIHRGVVFITMTQPGFINLDRCVKHLKILIESGNVESNIVLGLIHNGDHRCCSTKCTSFCTTHCVQEKHCKNHCSGIYFSQDEIEQYKKKSDIALAIKYFHAGEHMDITNIATSELAHIYASELGFCDINKAFIYAAKFYKKTGKKYGIFKHYSDEDVEFYAQ